MGSFVRCCAALSVATFVLIAGTALYLYLGNDHLGCYTPHNGKVCYADQPETERYEMYATKTNYSTAVRWAEQQHTERFAIDGCKPVLFYLFQRHTTRYPDREGILSNQKTLETIVQKFDFGEGKTRFCDQDIENLRHWFYPFVPDLDNLVTQSGTATVKRQVRRLMQRFPEVFQETRPFNPDMIKVDFTERNRSQDTAHAFLEEWFTEDVFNKYIEAQISTNLNGKLLEFHKLCASHLKAKGVSTKNAPEVKKLEASSYYKTLLETLSDRLGFHVDYAEMKAMYSQCTYEKAIYGPSPWCAVFTNDDLKLLEFREDLDDYYKDSYGDDRNWKQACPVAKDLFERIAEAESPASVSDGHPYTILHFSHAGAIKKVMAYFGIGQGPKIGWNDLCSPRGWHSSQYAPFNANILFVMYGCGEKRIMTTFVNEKLVKLPGCSSEQCPFEEFQARYGRMDFECDLSKICV